MARNVNTEKLERLLEARRRSQVWLIVTLIAVGALVAVLISVGAALPVGFCVLAGLGVGRLVNAPYLRLLKELGLTRPEAMAILVADRERRNGLAALPPQDRAQREQRASRVYLICGLAAAAVLVVAAVSFFSKANKTVDENAPTDVWFAISAIAGFVTLILAPTFLWMAALRRKNAAAWGVVGAANSRRKP